jgi:hypothetical protein
MPEVKPLFVCDPDRIFNATQCAFSYTKLAFYLITLNASDSDQQRVGLGGRGHSLPLPAAILMLE